MTDKLKRPEFKPHQTPLKIKQDFLFRQGDEPMTIKWQGFEKEERCTDFDADCWGIQSKLQCWFYTPECGVCPFLTGEIVDDTVKDDLK